MELMKADPKLKVVLKEFPVLSAGSVEAAQVGVAVRMQDPTGKKYLDFHQKLLTGRGAADKARAMAVAKEVGLDMAQLEKDLGSAEVRTTLEENFKLAEAMGMNGTPSYVIGKQVVIGAVGVTPEGKDQQRALRQGDVLRPAGFFRVAKIRLRRSRIFCWPAQAPIEPLECKAPPRRVPYARARLMPLAPPTTAYDLEPLHPPARGTDATIMAGVMACRPASPKASGR